LIDDEAIAYHEGIPGHHMQLSVQQQLTGLPRVSSPMASASTLIEGWALYAEQLVKEVGFYQDPVSGLWRALSSELFRAVRLVVDTGIHSQGWSRESGGRLQCATSGAVDEPTIQSETRSLYCVAPTSSQLQVGAAQVSANCANARKRMGPKFDIRTFHDEIARWRNPPARSA